MSEGYKIILVIHTFIRVTDYKLTNQTIIEVFEVVPNMNRNTLKKK